MTVRLSARTVRLSARTVRLSACTVRLSARTVRLSARTVRLSARTVRLSARTVHRYLLFCQILTNREFHRQIFEKMLDIKIQENRSSGSPVVPCGQTDGHDRNNSRFSQFCERNASKPAAIGPHSASHGRSLVCALL
jgi:hypothetical protein